MGRVLPDSARRLYHGLLFIVGLVMAAVFFFAYLCVLWPICALDTALFHGFRSRRARGKGTVAQREDCAARARRRTLSRLIPAFVRNRTAEYRLALICTRPASRGLWWSARFYLLQFACFLEYIPNARQPLALFEALADEFGGAHFPSAMEWEWPRTPRWSRA